jgi:hypothetical protein
MADEVALNTRVYIAGLGRESDRVDHLDIEDTAYMASEALNAAVAGENEFVHFKLANGGSMAIKLSRILHVSEAAPGADE